MLLVASLTMAYLALTPTVSPAPSFPPVAQDDDYELVIGVSRAGEVEGLCSLRAGATSTSRGQAFADLTCWQFREVVRLLHESQRRTRAPQAWAVWVCWALDPCAASPTRD